MSARKNKLFFLKICTGLLLCSIFLVMTCACGKKEKNRDLAPLDFTIVPPEELPEALASIIEDKKTGDMSLTYTTDSELYIVKGYGTRPNDGYSVVVKNCSRSDDEIVFVTDLIGPKKDQNTSSLPSYPYVVVKLQAINLPVSFE